MAEVIELKEAYQLKGLTPTLAMQKAVKLMVEPAPRAGDRHQLHPRVSTDDVKKDVAAERKKDAVGKTVDAVAKTPPSLKDVGKDSDKQGGGRMDANAVMRMSQKDFASIDDKTLSALRGDTI